MEEEKEKSIHVACGGRQAKGEARPKDGRCAEKDRLVKVRSTT